MTGSIAWLLAACVTFVASHVVLSGTPLRGRLVGLLGERAFLAAYSALAFVELGWMAVAYNGAPFIDLWHAGDVLVGLAWVIMVPAVLLAVCGAAGRNPTAVGGGRLISGDLVPGGVLTITRHPLMTGIALWAIAHILVNGDLASLVFFGSLLLLVIVGVPSQEAKKRAAHGEDWRRFAAATSVLPFVAVLQGRSRLDLAGIGALWYGVSAVVYVLLVVLHTLVIGVSPLPA